MTQCPICEGQLRKTDDRGERIFYECLRCGPYSLSREARQELDYWLKRFDKSRPILSYALYRMTKREQWAILTTDLIENILGNTVLPKHREQLDNFIVWMASTQPKYGYHVGAVSEEAIAAIGAEDETALGFVVSHAINLGLIDGKAVRATGGVVGFTPLSLTFAGWSRLDEIQRGNTSTRIAFMAMKFGDEQTDSLYRDYFKPAVKDCDFDLKRLDEGQPAGLIDDRLRVEIRQSRFLIADLTHNNNGAYWEAGFAEGLGKPVIYTCRKDVFEQGTHFDTNHHLTVIWEWDKVEEAVSKLKNTIRATLPSDAKLED